MARPTELEGNLAAFLVLLRHAREPREISERDGVDWWAGRDGQSRRTTPKDEQARAQRDTPLALAPSGAKPRVSFERLEIGVPAPDGIFEIVQCHVLAPADQG